MSWRATGDSDYSASWPEVQVACVWLPQFPLWGEVLRHPAWEGYPLVLGGGPGERKVVQLCSPEAEQSGLYPGLPLREVIPLCPDAIVLQPDPVRTASVLEEAVRQLQRVSPSVESVDEQLFLDLRGLAGVYQHDLARLELAIRGAVPSILRPRLGLAGGTFTAAVAARVAPPRGCRVVPMTDTVAFLASLPISHLGLSPEVVQPLGLHTIGDLAALPFGAVQAEFGLAGARAWRRAHGQDDEPIIPRPRHPSIRAALRFDDPLASTEAIFAALQHLLGRAFGDPRLRSRSVRQARLRALLADGASWERLVTFKEAVGGREVAYRALKSKLELANALPPAPIEELALELLELSGEAARQPSLFSAHPRQLPPILEAARQLRARYGQGPLYHAIEVEPWSRIPERRWTLLPYDR
jgi:DNA polymerase-4/protein ImuB